MILALVLAATPFDATAADLSKHVADAGFAPPVGVYVEGSPAPASRALASLVMAGLAEAHLAPVPVTAPNADAAEVSARDQRLSSLVRLTVNIEGGKVVVRGDALSTHVNFWSGSTPVREGPAVALFAAADADDETLAMLGQTAPPKELRLLRFSFAKLSAWPAAVAVTETEVSAIVGEELLVWTLDGKLKSHTELSGARSTHPTREPFGWISGSRAWTSRHELQPLTWAELTLTPRAGFASFEPTFTWSKRTSTWPESISQFSASGPVTMFVTPSGRAAISRGDAASRFVTNVGSGSALTDFDGDNVAEVVATLFKTGNGDEVRVLTLRDFEAAQARNQALQELTPLWQDKLSARAVVAAGGRECVVLGLWKDDGTGELVMIRREK